MWFILHAHLIIEYFSGLTIMWIWTKLHSRLLPEVCQFF